mmetsp:Transcript_137157/g.347496  ORF Transcript_137157/g.347496 Transcript_137157/m.347496 type:complete len:306 (+) Transcript_137157:159-1076(+)
MPSASTLRDPATDPSMWAISYKQLEDFAKELKKKWGGAYSLLTMRDIVAMEIRPHCAKHRCSYALSKNPQGRRVAAFVTHCWDESFEQFFLAIQSMTGHMQSKPDMFICSFSLLQGDAATVAAQVDVSIDASPFVSALKQADLFMAVRNSVVDIYSRGWCIVEIITAMQLGLVGGHRTLIGGPDTFASSSGSCFDFRCYDKRDRIKLLRYILDRSEDDIDKVDSMISEFRSFGDDSRRMAAEAAAAEAAAAAAKEETEKKVRALWVAARGSSGIELVRESLTACYPGADAILPILYADFTADELI